MYIYIYTCNNVCIICIHGITYMELFGAANSHVAFHSL